MVKNILSVLIFFFSVFFLFSVVKIYFLKNQKYEIKNNRLTQTQIIQNNIENLPILHNDTNNVIEFNSGFEKTNVKTKRNFWKLFKQND